MRSKHLWQHLRQPAICDHDRNEVTYSSTLLHKFEALLPKQISFVSLPIHASPTQSSIFSKPCWLCRWAGDLLVYEEAAECDSDSEAKNLLEDALIPFSVSIDKRREIAPRIWRKGGMNPVWIRAVLSADAFFVHDEQARYNIAKRVVELRRRDYIDESEEVEWDNLFTNGIHYMHMVRLLPQ